MTDRKEDEVKLTEEEIDHLLIETLNNSSPGYMNTNEQENVDEFLELSEEEIDRLLMETTNDFSPLYMNTNEQDDVNELVKLPKLEEIERIKKEEEEREEIERIRKEKEEREEIARIKKEKEEREEIERIKREKEEQEEIARIKKEKEEREEIERIKKEKEEQEEIARIKKEKECREEIDLMLSDSPPGYLSKAEQEEIDRLLNEMAKDSPLEYMSKKEEEDWDEFMNSMMIKEEQPESSTKSRNEFQPNIPKSRKRSAMTVPDLKASELDPLQIAMEMLLKYHDFVSYMLALLSKERGNAEIEMQKWKKLINRGNQLIKSMNLRLKRLSRKMERMKKDENLQKQYVFRKIHLEEIIGKLRDVNAGIEGSADFSLVSDVRYTEKVLPNCLKLLRSSKEELSVLIQIIEVLEVMNKEEDDDEY